MAGSSSKTSPPEVVAAFETLVARDSAPRLSRMLGRPARAIAGRHTLPPKG